MCEIIKFKFFFKKKNIIRFFSYLLLIISGILLLISDFGTAWLNIKYFSSFPADGAFQLYNGLKRLANGFIYGKDFYFFHGTGILFFHYPTFLIFGKNLFASELSRWMMSLIIYYVSFFIFLKSLDFSNKTILIFIIFFNLILRNIFFLHNLVFPGGSSLSVRSAVPLIIFAALSFIFKYKKINLKIIFFFALFSSIFILFFSTEQGISYLLSMIFLINTFYFIKNNFFKKKIFFIFLSLINFVFISLLILLFLLFYFILFKENYINILKYNFIEVGKDQFWYFALPPQNFIANVFDFFKDYFITFRLSLFFLNLFLIVNLFRVKKLGKNLFILFMTIKIYALFNLIPLLGIMSSVYLEPFLRIELIILFYLLYKYIFNKRINSLKYEIIFSFLLFFISISPFYYFLGFYKQIKININKEKKIYYKGVIISDEWKESFEMFRKNIKNKSKIWSTYSSLAEDMFGNFNPSKFDYIIHALGKKNRYSYIKDLMFYKPEYIITINPRIFPFEHWLLKENYDFYDYLFRNYKLLNKSYYHLLWKRDQHIVFFKTLYSKEQKNNSSELKFNNESIILDINNISKKLKTDLEEKKVLVIFKIQYSLENIYSKIPLIGNIFRAIYFVNTNINNNPIGLPPYNSYFVFPVITQVKNNNLYINLGIRIYPKLPLIRKMPGIDIKVTNVSYQVIDYALLNEFLEF